MVCARPRALGMWVGAWGIYGAGQLAIWRVASLESLRHLGGGDRRRGGRLGEAGLYCLARPLEGMVAVLLGRQGRPWAIMGSRVRLCRTPAVMTPKAFGRWYLAAEAFHMLHTAPKGMLPLADVEDKVGRGVPIQNAHNLHIVCACLHAHIRPALHSPHANPLSTYTAHCTQYTRGHANSSQPTSQHSSSVLISSAQLPLVTRTHSWREFLWLSAGPNSPPGPQYAPHRSHALRQGGDQSSTIYQRIKGIYAARIHRPRAPLCPHCPLFKGFKASWVS